MTVRIPRAAAHRLQRALQVVAFSAALAPSARAGDLAIDAILIGRGVVVESQPSWTAGGFGRLTEGGSAAGDRAVLGRGQAHAGLDWRPAASLLLHAHALARVEPEARGGQRAGLTEVFLQYRPEISPRLSLRFRAGTFFPPTSRENVERLWSSPYTMTLSAWNSWIGEEVRLSGLESAVTIGQTGRTQLQLAGTAFGGADTMGALLAWRGWALGDRLATVGEVVPLPPLATLRDGGRFGRQRDDGTRPIDELDGRLGFQARARLTAASRGTLQAAYLDNRGDRRLRRGQYCWATRFTSAGGDLRLGPLTLVGEAGRGDTGMGTRDTGVDVRFEAAYALVSWGGPRARLSARYDRFSVHDLVAQPEPHRESGRAWTAAGTWFPARHLRLGAEVLQVTAQRPAAAFAGADPDTDARRALLEARVVF